MTKKERVAFAVLGAACALAPSLAMWGFTVDDALIPVRYARHLASGAGYVFDLGSPPTDGVTPLPWAFLLWPLAHADALVVLARAKLLGVAAWTLAGAALGGAVRARSPDRLHAVAALAIVALAFPIGAWAASGLETGLVTALATLAATRAASSPRRAAIGAGLAASLRPELLPWALVLVALASLRAPPRVRIVALASSALPWLACVGVRLAAFGRPVPLSVLAKPSDLEHGLAYAAAAAIVVLTPLLAFAPVATARSHAARAIGVAFVVHLLAVAGVGGDWMPYARLVVPVAPSLALVFAETSAAPSRTRVARGLAWLRVGLAAAFGVLGATSAAPPGRGVGADREALVVAARPVLASSRVVAALDIGWVAAAFEGTIVDLAGLTDPSIAVLGGGHTSKRVDATMLLDREVDTVVVYSSPRVVEARLLRAELFGERFERVATLPLNARASYDVYRRKP